MQMKEALNSLIFYVWLIIQKRDLTTKHFRQISYPKYLLNVIDIFPLRPRSDLKKHTKIYVHFNNIWQWIIFTVQKDSVTYDVRVAAEEKVNDIQDVS